VADLLGCDAVRVLESAELDGGQAGAGDGDGHVGELALGELEGRQWPAELRAGEAVAQRLLEAGPSGADGAPQDAVPRLVEAREWALEPAHLREGCRVGEPDVVQDEFRGDRGAKGELSLDLVGGKAGR